MYSAKYLPDNLLPNKCPSEACVGGMYNMPKFFYFSVERNLLATLSYFLCHIWKYYKLL